MNVEEDRTSLLVERVVARTLVYVRDGRLSRTVLDRVLTACGANHLHDEVCGRLTWNGVRLHDDRLVREHHGDQQHSRPPRPDVESALRDDSASDTERALAAARQLLRSDNRNGALSRRILTASEEVGLSLLMNGTGQPLPQGTLRKLTGEARAAAHAMVIHNQGLVWSVVRQYVATGIEPEDLFQHGCTGLLRAVEMFNPQNGTKFSTYATHWIRQAITRGIANESRLIRVPVHMHERIMKVRRELQCRQTSSENAPIDEIALATDMSSDQVVECFRLMSSVASLDQSAGTDTEATLGDFLEYSSIPGPEEAIVRDSFADMVTDTLAALDERSRKILRMRHGFDDLEPMTLDQIGARFGITRERVRQLEKKALTRLRDEIA